MYTTPDVPPRAPLPPPLSNPLSSYPPSTAVTPPVAVNTRPAAFALLGAAAASFVALISKSWFTAGSEGYLGPLGIDRCYGVICKSTNWFDAKHIPPQIPIFATCTLIAGLVAVAFMIHGAVMLLQGAPEKVKLRWLAQTIGLAAMGAICFVFSLSIGDWSRGLSVGWSTFVGLGGTLAAAAIAGVMLRPLVSK